MPEIKHRQDKASPEIKYAEIFTPDDKQLGTGTFRTVIEPDALSAGKAISSIIIQVPAFQISINLNPSTREIPVLLGVANGSEPISKEMFLFPEDINVANTHEFEVTFQDWRIVGLSMDGTLLSQQINGKQHAENLGRFITNLHALETTIRDFLLTASEGLQSSVEHAQGLRNLRVGQSVPLNPFTSYDDLRALIVKYNKRVDIVNRLVIDENIVQIRDAIAHGQVFSFEPLCPLLLLKFSKPEGSLVKVEFSATMTPDWFESQIKRVHSEFSKVVEASHLLANGEL